MKHLLQPLLFIQGTTATGKTCLALAVAESVIAKKMFSGVKLISADSRQVYQGLEILSGADIPDNFSRKKQSSYNFFQHSSLPIELHGVSLIKPQEEWSVAHFLKLARAQVKTAWAQNCLPIIVGGTGFYHQQLTQPEPSIAVKPNEKLRQQAADLTVEELQAWLSELDPNKLQQLNQSDRNNPRRLTRAIEICLNQQQKEKMPSTFTQQELSPSWQLTVALKLDLPSVKTKIKQRIQQRLQANVMQEVDNLSLMNLPINSPALSATGAQPLLNYQQGNISLDEAKKLWLTQELQYAKRQITWLKKYQPDLWLEAHHSGNLQTILAQLCQENKNSR